MCIKCIIRESKSVIEARIKLGDQSFYVYTGKITKIIKRNLVGHRVVLRTYFTGIVEYKVQGTDDAIQTSYPAKTGPSTFHKGFCFRYLEQ